jgi:hypothetical protein
MFGSRGWVAQDARKPSRAAKSKPITSAATTTAEQWGLPQVQFKPGDPGDPGIGLIRCLLSSWLPMFAAWKASRFGSRRARNWSCQQFAASL